ncbi:hypothetical protein P3T76_012476 [Phytophthora citrophthora]|uniref:Uncharacterized protein n=1 Tax=Phytophthora citrophthora TaxID=4793 RepID=A0AAD9G518_9STRA|nr:hypothetical protein P3T76_012476 [Phytophthora citrophthora]
MAFDPYQSLLTNGSRGDLKRSANLNTHLVGNVFLPAIDAQHKKISSEPTASLKHLKVIEQCIKAENKREQRLAKCTTIKERRIMTTKFQAQRERERDLIQALMFGDYSDQQLEIELLEKQAAVATSPRQQLNYESTGLSSRVATPDRVFRKADFTGGSTAKPHAHKKFKLPECNGSPGKKVDAKEQQATSLKLSSPPRKAPASAEPQPAPIRKKRSPSRSAGVNSVNSPKVQAEAEASPKRAPSPYISRHRHQAKSAKATVQLSSLPSKTAETVEVEDTDTVTAINDFPVVFERAASFSEAHRLADTMGSDAQLLKEKCERILAEMATQTTARLAEVDPAVEEAPSPSELPPIDLTLAVVQDDPATTPRRPQSDRVQRSTRQSFPENLAREDKILQERKEAAIISNDTSVSEATDDDPEEDKAKEIANEGEVEGQKSTREEEEEEETQHNAVEDEDSKETPNSADTASEEEYGDDFTEADASSDNEIDLETDVADALLTLINNVEAQVTEEAKQKVIDPSPRIVSPRPRLSMVTVFSVMTSITFDLLYCSLLQAQTTKHLHIIRIQSVFRGYRARIAFRLALYEDALSCGVLGAMPGTVQGQSGWYLDPKRLIAYYFVIPDPDGEWEQKFSMRCGRMVLTPYEMRAEVLSKAPKDLLHVT